MKGEFRMITCAIIALIINIIVSLLVVIMAIDDGWIPAGAFILATISLILSVLGIIGIVIR